MHGADIAGELGVSRPTVSVALKCPESYEALKTLARETLREE